MMSSIPSIRVSFAASSINCLTSVTVPRWLGFVAITRARTRLPASARSPTQSMALCRTNSSGQRSAESTTPSSSSTSAFCVDAPRMSPIPRSISISRRKPNVRAGASSCAKHSGVTAYSPHCRPISGCGKSISTRRESWSAGSTSYDASPSVTRTGRTTSRYCTSPSCSAMPAEASASTYGLALPSRMGGSWASISIVRSSITDPPTAARTCSTVCSERAPSPSCVRRSARTACSTRAGISGVSGRSTRRKRTPAPLGAGRKVMRQCSPRCRPTPSSVTGERIVRRRSVIPCRAPAGARSGRSGRTGGRAPPGRGAPHDADARDSRTTTPPAGRPRTPRPARRCGRRRRS